MKLTVSQNVNRLNLTATQNETVVELQPVIYIGGDGQGGVDVETDPIFTQSEAYFFEEGDKATLDNLAENLPKKLDKPVLLNDGSFNSVVVVDDSNRSSKIPIEDLARVTQHSSLILDDGTNPHGTTKTDIGLSNVDNTSDINKPISSATQYALNGKVDKNTSITANTMMYVKNPDGTQGLMPIYNKPRVFSFNTLFNVTNTTTATFKSISLAGTSNTYNVDTSITVPEELISHTPFKWQLSVPFNCKLTRISMSINSGSHNQIIIVKGDNISASFANKILVYKGNSETTQTIDDRSPVVLSNLNKYDFISLYITTTQTVGTNYGFINLEFEEI